MAREFGELYPGVYRHLHRRRDPREWRPGGETIALLQHLRDSGPLTIGEAARHFDRSQAAISERVERLVGRGLLERAADRRDKRRHFVWITEAAERLIEVESEVLSRELLRRVSERMTSADRAALIRGMRALLDAAGRHARSERDESTQEER